MRCPLRSFDAFFPAAILLACLGFACERPLAAQFVPPPSSQNPTPPGMPGTGRPGLQGDDEPMSPTMKQLNEQQANKRNDLRQKLIVDDTARLLTLAQQLKEDADKGKISPSSVAFAKKVDEIEKLAKAVKEKMREGQ
jgi:hypothetical protein